jgi:hypothetical protein
MARKLRNPSPPAFAGLRRGRQSSPFGKGEEAFPLELADTVFENVRDVSTPLDMTGQ